MALHPAMAEALRLTRSANLTEAMALLRDRLGAGARPVPLPLRGGPAVHATARRATTDEAGDTVREPAGPDGRFESRRHVGRAGTIEYMLYKPASAKPGIPLIVMLHGCTQSPEDFARGTAMNRLADEFSFLVAYPRQIQSANMQKCWNWFQPGHQQRDQGEPALIAGLTRDIVALEDIDAARVYVAGLSAGGAAAAIMADTYPDLFAAVGIHSGLARGAARDLPSALTAMQRGAAHQPTRAGPNGGRFVPVITFHGDRDGTVGEINARDIVRAATAMAAPLSVTSETGEANGRRYTRARSIDDRGRVMIEQWTVSGAGHAWSGGDPAGSYVDASGPEASRAMLEFFFAHRCTAA